MYSVFKRRQDVFSEVHWKTGIIVMVTASIFVDCVSCVLFVV